MGTGPGSWCERAPEDHLRLLITDPFHPVTAPTMIELRGKCPGCQVVAIDAAAAGQPAPPGVDVVVPAPPPEAEGFVEALCATAAVYGADTVLTWSDRDAYAVSRELGRLVDVGLAVVCPPTELVELTRDKWATVQRLAELGVLVPGSVLVHDGAELIKAARELGYPHRSLVLKPRGLSGGKGVWLLRAGADPMAGGPFPHLPVEAMALALDQCPAVARQAGFVVQHEVSGVDVSVDVLAQDGHLVAAAARTREATLGGLSVQGLVSPLTAGLQDVIRAVVAGLGWSSLANIQLVMGAGGPTIYEINPRAAGSIGLNSYAGVDLLSAAIHLARTGTAPENFGDGVAGTVRFRRYWLDQWWPAPAEPGWQ